MDNSVSEYTICSTSSSARRRNSRSQTSEEFTIDSDDEGKGESTSGSPEPLASTEPHVSHRRSSAPQPHILIQGELNYLVRDLELSKSKAELLGSRQWNLLEKKKSKFLRFAVVVSNWYVSSERNMTLCSATM